MRISYIQGFYSSKKRTILKITRLLSFIFIMLILLTGFFDVFHGESERIVLDPPPTVVGSADLVSALLAGRSLEHSHIIGRLAVTGQIHIHRMVIIILVTYHTQCLSVSGMFESPVRGRCGGCTGTSGFTFSACSGNPGGG